MPRVSLTKFYDKNKKTKKTSKKQLQKQKEARQVRMFNGFSYVLTAIFIVLKTFGCIDWNWIWIFSPLWLPLVIATVMIFLVLLFVSLIIVGKEVTKK